jgi:hypothetical protein
VAGGRWVVSHGPMGRGLLLRRTRVPLDRGPGVPEGYGLAEWDCLCLWIASLAGFRGMILAEIVQACASMRGAVGGDLAGLCRTEGHGPVEIMNVSGSLAWQS